jgi:hypothetical protein
VDSDDQPAAQTPGLGSSKVAHRCTCLRFTDGLGTPTGKGLRNPECPQHGERTTCWICGKALRKPDKAIRALCHICATGGGLGPYT